MTIKILLKEIKDLSPIQTAIDRYNPKDFAFGNVFGSNFRIILDYPVQQTEEHLAKEVYDKMPNHLHNFLYSLNLTMNSNFTISKTDVTKLESKQIEETYKKIYRDKGVWFSSEWEEQDNRGNDYDEFYDFKVDKLLRQQFSLFSYMNKLEKIGTSFEKESVKIFKEAELSRKESIKNNPKAINTTVEFFFQHKVRPIPYYILLSRNPIDVLRMSDYEHIRSCHSEGGSYFNCAVDEANGNGFVAYVIRTDNIEEIKKNINKLEILRDKTRGVEGIVPISRMRMRKIILNFTDLEKNDNNITKKIVFFVPDGQIYGSKDNLGQDLNKFLCDFAQRTQQKQIDYLNQGNKKIINAVIATEYVNNEVLILKNFYNMSGINISPYISSTKRVEPSVTKKTKPRPKPYTDTISGELLHIIVEEDQFSDERTILYKNSKDERHRIDGPAEINFINGKKTKEVWWDNGNISRSGNNPTQTYYYVDGTIARQFWFVDNELHNTAGPAFLLYDEKGRVKREQYFINGKLHNLEHAAKLVYDSNDNVIDEEYYIDGVKFSEEEFERKRLGNSLTEQLSYLIKSKAPKNIINECIEIYEYLERAKILATKQNN